MPQYSKLTEYIPPKLSYPQQKRNDGDAGGPPKLSKMELSRLNNSALINAMTPTVVPEPESAGISHASWNKFFGKKAQELQSKLLKLRDEDVKKQSQKNLEFDIMKTPSIPFFCVEREEFIK